MVTQEQLEMWREHPISRALISRANELVDHFGDVRNITMTENHSVSDIGAEAIGRTNYVAGIEAAMDLESLVDEEEVE